MQKLNETPLAKGIVGEAVVAAMLKVRALDESQYLVAEDGRRWLRVALPQGSATYQFLDRNSQDVGMELTRAAYFHWTENTMREFERLMILAVKEQNAREDAREQNRKDALITERDAHRRQLRHAGATHVVEHKGRRYYARKVTQRVGLFRRKADRWELLGTDFEPFMVFPESIETTEAKLVTMIFWDDSTYQSGDFARRQA